MEHHPHHHMRTLKFQHSEIDVTPPADQRVTDVTPPADHHKEHSALMGHSLAFHGGSTETILFEFWKIDGIGGLLGSMMGVFMMAALYEGLKYYRDYLFWRTYSDMQYQAVAIPPEKRDDARLRPSRLSLPHCIQTAIYALQIIISYFLMLIFMTYNLWLCVAIVLGYAVGYFIFSWKKSILVDVTEPCH